MRASNLPDFDLLKALRVFVSIVDTGSMSAACEQLDMARGQPSRYLAKLEDHLGLKLLQRTTRQQALTPDGAALYQRARQLLQLVEETELELAGHQQQVKGVLRVSAPVSFGIRHLAPLMARYKQQFPQVAVEVTLNDSTVDLVEEGFDLALRIAERLPPGLVARPLGLIPQVICASPGYLHEHAPIAGPQDLSRHDCLLYTNAASGHEWRLRRDGQQQRVRVTGDFRSNNGETLVAAACAGLGVALMPRFLVEEALARGELVTILPEWQLPEAQLHAVYPDRRWLPRRVRVFIDLMADHFAAEARQPQSP